MAAVSLGELSLTRGLGSPSHRKPGAGCEQRELAAGDANIAGAQDLSLNLNSFRQLTFQLSNPIG